ncbi:MAG: DNA recombination protein RmuC [Rhodospirillales bacterium]
MIDLSLHSPLGTIGGELLLGVSAGFTVAVFFVLVVVLLRGERARGEAAVQLARVGDMADRLALAQAELAGRLDQGHRGLDERIDALGRRVGDGLLQQTERTAEHLRVLHERLAVIDSAGKSIGELTLQVGGLAEILSNKQARGAFGEIQLYDLVRAVLPSAAYAFQVTLGNGTRVDCLLRLPEPPGPIAVDAKFPLESYRVLRRAADEASRTRAARSFAQDVGRHVRDIQEKYLVPGETADSAMLFLPSEAVYAELHANFPNVVEDAFRRKVWIVSPTTLWATLNTLRAVLRDVRLREDAHALQAALQGLIGDLNRLNQRVLNLQRHFDQASEDVRQVFISTEKAMVRAARLDLSRLVADDGEAVPTLAETDRVPAAPNVLGEQSKRNGETGPGE